MRYMAVITTALYLALSSCLPTAIDGFTAKSSAAPFVIGRRHSNSFLRASSNIAYDDVCDILVLGSGPAGCAAASVFAAGGKNDVIMADQNLDRPFVPNYGVWEDEWDAIVDRYNQAGVPFRGGNEDRALDRVWKITDCFFGGSFGIPTDYRMRLQRPYCRVDRKALKESLTAGKYRRLYANHFSQAIATNIYSPAGSLVHDDKGTLIQLRNKDDDIITVRAKLVVDCTGHETKLVMREARDHYVSPGFQIAYGCLADLDESSIPDVAMSGPYDKEAMTLFDYRTDHFDNDGEETLKKVEKAPTFMYVMPLANNQVFFEETSLVARPGLSFQECKDRCFQRLEYHGIKVSKIQEEFCYIPMGGALPGRDQRVLACGGAAVAVHPSTGYNICRTLVGIVDLAAAVQAELDKEEPNLDRAAAAAYGALWTPEAIRQRNFAVFGGEFLMKQNVVGLRGFFDGFFRLPIELWGGFLAGWKGLPNNDHHESWAARLWFGLSFVARIPPPVALNMLLSIVTYSLTEGTSLMQSVTPFFGQPEGYDYKRNNDFVGDVAVKREARRMIVESSLQQDVPVDFNGEQNSISGATTLPNVPATEKEVQEFA